jgi:hypothetical protein
MDNIEKKVLPSNGLLEDVPREVAIRGMRGREISTVLSSLTDASVDEVIKSVTNPSLEPENLCDEDKKFVLHQTRILTFGEEIQQTLRCPFCGHIHDYTINYSDLELTYLEEEVLNDVLELSDGTKITRRIPSSKTMEEIIRYKDKVKFPPSYSFLFLQASRIGKVNGKKMPIGEMITWLENIPGKELSKISKFLDIRFGLDTTFEVECAGCGTSFTGGIGISADLFR